MTEPAADHALAYAELGWPVFPLAPRSKVPLLAGNHGGKGLYDATTDTALIKAWWSSNPTANIGLRTGVVFDVLDIDSTEGVEQLNAVRADAEGLTGPMVHTGKGWHLYFSSTGLGNRAAVLPGVDFRGDGGYVVAPPSIHPDGRLYEWDPEGQYFHDLQAIPSWLTALIGSGPRSLAITVGSN